MVKMRSNKFWEGLGPFYFILVCLWRILACLVILVLFFLLIVSRPNFMVKKIEQLLNAKLPQGMSVTGLSFSKIEPSLTSVSARDISFSFKQAQDIYTVSAENIFLSNVLCLASQTGCRLLIENVNVASKDLKIDGAQGYGAISFRPKERSANGSVAVDSIRYKEYAVTNAHSNFDMTDNVVVFERASAQAYQGLVKAEGRYQFLPDEKLEIALDFKGIDTHNIDGLNSQWKGVAEGKASYTGTLSSIGSLTLEFRSSSSEMERKLLRYLMGDINNNFAFLPFSKILESADFIHLDNFQGTVHNLDQDSVSVQLNLESRQLNLKMNPDITINLR